MLVLKLYNRTTGKAHPLVSDTNIPPEALRKVTYVSVKGRGTGVGSFNGRAPQRAVIDMGSNSKGQDIWKSVPLPDGYDIDSITQVEIVDTQNQLPVLQFKKDHQKPNTWHAQHPDYITGDSGVQSEKALQVRQLYKERFDYLGGVGVNDLGNRLVVTLQVPTNYNTAENQTAWLDYAETLQEQYGNVDLEVSEVGNTTDTKKHLMEGNLGESNLPGEILAGRHPLEPVNVGSNPTPISAAGIRPFDREGQSGGPGHNAQDYGAGGPLD